MADLYLSHGMGVNSTALMILLEQKGIDFESVFINHGGDYPETYEYLNYLRDEGYDITELKPNVEGCVSLEAYCLKYNLKPLGCNRWCTDKFKIRVIRNYIRVPCTMYLGIDGGEKHRAYKKPIKTGVCNHYPLVEQDIDRDGCKQIIRKAGLKVPMKSGCWFCCFSRKGEIKELKKNYPDLYERRKRIEINADKSYAKRHYHVLPNYMGVD